MRFLILLIPFYILSTWVWTAIASIYRDIFIYHNFMETIRGVEWYYLLADVFFMGVPLWATTVYFVFKKWQFRSNISYLESFYLFMSYFAFMMMQIGHMTRPFFWGTMLAIHILFLILIVVSPRKTNE